MCGSGHTLAAMCETDDEFQAWYEVVNAHEFHQLSDDFPEFAANLIEGLRAYLARLVRRWRRKPPEGDLWITWSPPDALRIGFGTDDFDCFTMRWDQTPEDARPTAEAIVERLVDQWPREPKSSS